MEVGGGGEHSPPHWVPLCRVCGSAMLGEGGIWWRLCWVNNELCR